MPIPLAVPMIASLGSSIFGAISANKQKKAAEEKERESRKEMERLKNIYANLDTSNPFLNMENVMEDLTINQKQAQFQRQQFQQSQANIMDTMRGAAGGSGVAAVAQALAQQGELASQKSAASIGQQESANQRLRQQEAGRIQGQERQGEIMSRNWEREKTSTLLGMSQSETAAYGQQAQQAQQAQWDAISSGIGAVTDFATAGLPGSGGGGGGGITNIYTGQGGAGTGGTGTGGTGGTSTGGTGSDRRLKKNIKLIGGSPSGLRIYAFEYINKAFGDGMFQGVMSDEIPQHAVIKHEDGYDRVDYSKLDVEFKNIN